MINDLLAYMQTDPGICLGGTHYMNTQIYKDKDTNGKETGSGTVVCFKSPQGYPVDTFPFDNLAIYMGSTEFDKQGWKNPYAIKLHVDVVIYSPRDIGLVTSGIANYSNSRRIQFDTPNPNNNPNQFGQLQFNGAHNPVFTVGQVVTEFRGLVKKDFGKDVGLQEAAIVDYYWNYPHDRETYYWTKKFGSVQWEHATLINNEYKIDNQSIFNVVKKEVKPPVINYPIGDILGNGK